MDTAAEIRRAVHDLNNALASVMGYAEFLVEDSLPDSKAHHYASSIKSGGQQAQAIVERLRVIAGDSKTDMSTSAATTNAVAVARHILVVDDQEDVRAMINLALERGGHKVTLCASALIATDILRDHPGEFDLVITDQTMPGMTGIEFAQQVADDFPSLPILLMTGYTDDAVNAAQRAIPTLREIVPKPVDFTRLLQTVASAT